MESHQNWSGLVYLLIILLYWCQGLCLPTSYRTLIEPCGAQSSSEVVLRLKHVLVSPKLQDIGMSEAEYFFSSSLGFILNSEIFKGSFVKTSLCILLKMGEQTVVILQPFPWILALPERFAWSWNYKYYFQGKKLPNYSRKSITHCASNFENISACLKWLFLG